MYRLKLSHHFDAAHRLELSYKSKCQNLHGHRWVVNVEITAETLNKEGMIIDFSEIKKIIDELDHKNLNDILTFNPTAENIVIYLHEKIEAVGNFDIDSILKVEVFESPNASISYEN